MERMVGIDGSSGEGGGQILRSALTLSALSGRPLHLVNIRAGRLKPGLMPQHLQAVKAAAAVALAEVRGADLGSRELLFTPGKLTPGRYRFDIGTAGATSLVLQTIFLPLTFAGARSSVDIRGGTHVPSSPSFHYLQWQWAPYLRRLGLDLDIHLKVAGFYPRGGGLLQAVIRPAGTLRPLQLIERGRLLRLRCLSLAAGLPLTVAERQSRRAAERLSSFRELLEITNELLPSVGKGTLLLLLAEFEESSACYFALGERGKPAEQVADEAVDDLLAFFATDGAVDEHLADQLALPLALASGESALRTSRITRHLVTNLEVISRFLPAEMRVEGEIDQPGTVRLRGIAPERDPRPMQS